MKATNMNILCLGIIFQIFAFKFVSSAKPQSFVENISDPKEWKKMLRTRTNILVLYTNGKGKSDIMSTFVEVSRELRGTATLVHIDCGGDGKKLCKKLRVETNHYLMKHYKDGEFHKDYDRKETSQSMITFLRDPSGDLPWDEDPIGENVFHVNDMNSFYKLLKRENAFMIMFYAPWCGFCKRLKPDYSSAATELKDSHTLVAMDVNKPENAQARFKYNITGFPTLVYFQNGAPKYTYEGENNKAGIVSFMQNPGKSQEKPKEDSWADEPSDVVHLTDSTFHDFIKTEPSVFVMFYAPWCGHCKKMKPEFTAAAALLKQKGIEGKVAAIDVTQEKKIGEEFEIKGFPTLKYFANGQLAYDVSPHREKDKIVQFMMDPKEPPPPPPPEVPWSETPSSVKHLTEETFRSFLKKKKHVLVMFYAPWCGHCKSAKPEFTGASDQFVDDPKVEFAAVDCTVHPQVCSSFEVRGYPTYKYFNYHKNSKAYDGVRTRDAFVRFMRDPDATSMELPVEELDPQDEWRDVEGAEHLRHLTNADFDSFLKNKKVLVLFYAPKCGHCKDMKGDYATAALSLVSNGSDKCLATIDANKERALSTRYNIKVFPTLKYFDDGVQVAEYNGPRTTASIIQFLNDPPTLPASKDEL